MARGNGDPKSQTSANTIVRPANTIDHITNEMLRLTRSMTFSLSAPVCHPARQSQDLTAASTPNPADRRPQKDKTFHRDAISSSVPKNVSRRLSQGRSREAVERSDILDADSEKLTMWHEGMKTPNHQHHQTLFSDHQTPLTTPIQTPSPNSPFV